MSGRGANASPFGEPAVQGPRSVSPDQDKTQPLRHTSSLHEKAFGNPVVVLTGYTLPLLDLPVL